MKVGPRPNMGATAPRGLSRALRRHRSKPNAEPGSPVAITAILRRPSLEIMPRQPRLCGSVVPAASRRPGESDSRPGSATAASVRQRNRISHPWAINVWPPRLAGVAGRRVGRTIAMRSPEKRAEPRRRRGMHQLQHRGYNYNLPPPVSRTVAACRPLPTFALRRA